MTQYLRGKQAGVQNDLSAGLNADLFGLDQVARYGINSQISALAYDPVQSLLAVGTSESRFGPGQIYIFGQKRVTGAFKPARPCSIRTLQFCGDRIIAMDSKNELTIYSLSARKIEAAFSAPGSVNALHADPTLDYVFLGLSSGEVVAYDMDRHGLAQLRIPNLWGEFQPRSRRSPIVTLALHPRDVGTLMIAYVDGIALYSFKQNKATQFLQYTLDPGAPGGAPDPATINRMRHPYVVQAVWHPTGTFIATGHDDASIVIWDPKTGRVVHARSLNQTNVNQPTSASGNRGGTDGIVNFRTPLFRLAWCSKKVPDDTGLLIAGGAPSNDPDRGLTFFDLGPTPVYQTTSWQLFSDWIARPKNTLRLSTPPQTDVVDFCLFPKDSPHYAGANDPIAVLALLASGELILLAFPSGRPIVAANQIPVSLHFTSPFTSVLRLSFVERTRWLGMIEKRDQYPQLLRGGNEATKPLMRFSSRNVVQTAHADGTVRIWDAGHGDEIENESVVQVDVARAIGRREGVQITQMSLSGAAGELAVGLYSGELVVFRWDRNRYYGQQRPTNNHEQAGFVPIGERAEPDVKEGLLPLTMFVAKRVPVTALRMSDVGFLAAGYEDGTLIVIDLRGPAVIFDSSISTLEKPSKRMSIRRSGSNQAQARVDSATTLEFGIMNLEGEDYASLLLFVGTSAGNLATLKLLPDSNGTYKAQMAGSTNLDDRVKLIWPMQASSGAPASASQGALAGLREGARVDGVVVVVTRVGVRIFKPAQARGASKTFGDAFCESAAVARRDERSTALVGVFGDGMVRTFNLPALREVSAVRIDQSADLARLSDAVVTPTGDTFTWVGPAEIAVLNPWGSGKTQSSIGDKLYSPERIVPPRPTISNMQWISGTQYFTASDLDILVGGPDRPPSKRMLEQMRVEERLQREGQRGQAGPSSYPENKEDEGYWSYMQRQIQERTQKLNVMGDNMERLEDASAGWADDVNKFIKDQKKKAVMGMIGGKLGL